jgi:hypothetical protein
MKKTIAELRRIEAGRLAELGDGNIKKAVSLMNSFYRFCGLEERVFYAENDERRYNSAYTRSMIERRDKWLEKLSRRFAEYGLKLVYCGYLPSIGIVYPESGGFSEKITRWFYD